MDFFTNVEHCSDVACPDPPQPGKSATANVCSKVSDLHNDLKLMPHVVYFTSNNNILITSCKLIYR